MSSRPSAVTCILQCPPDRVQRGIFYNVLLTERNKAYSTISTRPSETRHILQCPPWPSAARCILQCPPDQAQRGVCQWRGVYSAAWAGMLPFWSGSDKKSQEYICKPEFLAKFDLNGIQLFIFILKPWIFQWKCVLWKSLKLGFKARIGAAWEQLGKSGMTVVGGCGRSVGFPS